MHLDPTFYTQQIFDNKCQEFLYLFDCCWRKLSRCIWSPLFIPNQVDIYYVRNLDIIEPTLILFVSGKGLILNWDIVKPTLIHVSQWVDLIEGLISTPILNHLFFFFCSNHLFKISSLNYFTTKNFSHRSAKFFSKISTSQSCYTWKIK